MTLSKASGVIAQFVARSLPVTWNTLEDVLQAYADPLCICETTEDGHTIRAKIDGKVLRCEVCGKILTPESGEFTAARKHLAKMKIDPKIAFWGIPLANFNREELMKITAFSMRNQM